MAIQDSSGLAGALATKFADDVTSVFNRKARTAGLIQAKDAASGDINWAVRDTDGQVASTSSYLAEGSDVTVFNTDGLGKAHLDYAQMSEGFGITPMAMAKAAATGNPAQLADLARDEMMLAAERLFSNLNKELLTGTGAANRIAGFLGTNGALMTGGVYAGIDKSAVPAFAGNSVDKAAAAITEQMIIDHLSVIDKASGAYPGAIVGPYKQRDALAAALKDNQRFVTATAAASGVTISGGYTGLSVSGVPVIAEKDMADDSLMFLALDDITLYQLPPADAAGAPFITMPNGLKLWVIRLPDSGSAKKFHLRTFVQMRVRRPNAHGAFVNLG